MGLHFTVERTKRGGWNRTYLVVTEILLIRLLQVKCAFESVSDGKITHMYNEEILRRLPSGYKNE